MSLRRRRRIRKRKRKKKEKGKLERHTISPPNQTEKKTFLPFQKKPLRSRTSDFFFAEKEKAIERGGEAKRGEGKSGGSVKSRLLSYNLSPP